jgi:hyperosmotically inducible periplasmic protein
MSGMRVFLALVVGVCLGAAGLWYYNTSQGKARVQSTGEQLKSAAKSAGSAVQEKLRILDLRTNDIKEELAHTGRVIRTKAQEAGQAIADATADSRATTAIKGKLLANRDLSALSISVNTTCGIVTLSGTVPSTEAVSKAMLLAMETDGVKEVISTLQIKAKN